MKTPITSKELEARFRKSKSPIAVEISGGLTVHARAARIQAFTTDVKRSNPRKSLLLIALSEE